MSMGMIVVCACVVVCLNWSYWISIKIRLYIHWSSVSVFVQTVFRKKALSNFKLQFRLTSSHLPFNRVSFVHFGIYSGEQRAKKKLYDCESNDCVIFQEHCIYFSSLDFSINTNYCFVWANHNCREQTQKNKRVDDSNSINSGNKNTTFFSSSTLDACYSHGHIDNIIY